MGAVDRLEGHEAPNPRGVATRVAVVQRQARPTLMLAAVFAVAAIVTAAVPHRTGQWLPLHLFLVGALLMAFNLWKTVNAAVSSAPAELKLVSAE